MITKVNYTPNFKVVSGVTLPCIDTNNISSMPPTTLEGILMLVSKALNIPVKLMKSKGKRRILFEARAFYVWVAYDLLGFNNKSAITAEINRTPANFYNYMNYINNSMLTPKSAYHINSIKNKVKRMLY